MMIQVQRMIERKNPKHQIKDMIPLRNIVNVMILLILIPMLKLIGRRF